MAKSFNQIKGDCKQCCLSAECEKNKEDIKHWLSSLWIVCQEGETLEVVESE